MTTRPEVENLINELSSKECSDCENPTTVHVCPKLNTRIGDILAKMFDGNVGLCHEQYRFFRKLGVLVKVRMLLFFWWPLGFQKSLQEIFQATEWEEVCSLCFKESPCGCGSDKMERIAVLKDEKVEALVEFLINLQLTK